MKLLTAKTDNKNALVRCPMIHACKTPVLRERRLHPRIGFDCPVRWSLGGADRAGLARDVSEAGIGFIARALSAPRPGQRVRIALELDEEQEWPADDDATVVRCEPQGNNLYSVGLRLSQPFTDLADT